MLYGVHTADLDIDTRLDVGQLSAAGQHHVLIGSVITAQINTQPTVQAISIQPCQVPRPVGLFCVTLASLIYTLVVHASMPVRHCGPAGGNLPEWHLGCSEKPGRKYSIFASCRVGWRREEVTAHSMECGHTQDVYASRDRRTCS